MSRCVQKTDARFSNGSVADVTFVCAIVCVAPEKCVGWKLVPFESAHSSCALNTQQYYSNSQHQKLLLRNYQIFLRQPIEQGAFWSPRSFFFCVASIHRFELRLFARWANANWKPPVNWILHQLAGGDGAGRDRATTQQIATIIFNPSTTQGKQLWIFVYCWHWF